MSRFRFLMYMFVGAAGALAAVPGRAGEDKVRIVCAFENPTEAGWWSPASARSISRRHSTQGRTSLEWRLRTDEENVLSAERLRSPGVSGTQKYMNFSTADELAIDVYNPTRKPVKLKVRLADKGGGIDNEAKSFYKEARLAPGKNTIRFGLDVLRSRDGSRRVNAAELVLVELVGTRPRSDEKLYLDNLRLVTYGDRATEASKRSVHRYDFGSADSARWRGFHRVSGSDHYSEERGWGWTEEPESATDGGPPDALGGDSVVCSKAAFKCRLADGDYRLWVLNAPSPEPTKSWSVSAGGKKLLGDEVHSKNFLSSDRLFRFADIEMGEKTNVFKEYFGRSHPASAADLKVTGGAVDIAFENVAPAAMVIFPAGSAEEMKAYFAKLEEARGEAFGEHFYQMPLPRPTSDEKPDRIDHSRGYILFVRDMMLPMYPNSMPRVGERGSDVKMETSLGACGRAVLGLVPMKETQVKITRGDLAAGEKLIKKEQIKFRRLMFQPEIVSPGVFRIAGSYLKEVESLKLKPGRTEFLWISVDPGEAAPGKYSGTIILSSSGENAAVKVEVQVHPLKLPNRLRLSVGALYRAPFITDANYRLGAFADRKEDAAKVLAAEMKDMAGRGFSAVTMPAVAIAKVNTKGRTVTLDLADMDAFADAAAKAGLGIGADNILPFVHVPGVLREMGARESSVFTGCYKDALVKLRDWVEGRGLSAVFWVYDARSGGGAHLREGLRCLELAKRVPGVRTLVLVPNDKSVRGDLGLLLPRASVVMTEPYINSRRTFSFPKENEEQSLWVSGDDATRFTFGFQPWGMGAVGRWHYDYQNWTMPYNPFAGGSGLVLPSKKGPVPTVDYERITEGLTDLRYVELLEATIDRAREPEQDRSTQALAGAAEKALGALKGQMPDFVGTAAGNDSYVREVRRKAGTWRRDIIKQVIGLKQAMGEVQKVESKGPEKTGPEILAPPKDIWEALSRRLPEGWDPVQFLIISGLGIVLVAAFLWIVIRWLRERKLEE